MKKGKTLTLILIISIVILLTLIAFAGIYMKKQNNYKNIVPEYKLGMDLSKKRVVTLKVSDETKSTIYDEEGNIVSSIPDDADKSKYKTETIKINSDEVLTEANYEKAKNTIEKRLNDLKAEGYAVNLSKKTGDIVVELPENDEIEKYTNVLTATGRFELASEKTGEVLLSNNDLKKASVSYYNSGESTAVYLTIELNKEGKEKLKEISKTYVETTEKETTKDEETGEETTKDTVKSNNAVLRMDWPSNTGKLAYSDVITQTFSEEMTDGTFQIRIGAATDNDTLQNYYDQAFQIATCLNSGMIEVEYETDRNEVLYSEINNNQILITVATIAILFIIISIVVIAKYKKMGLLGTISNIGMISLTVILVKLTKATIAITVIPVAIAIIIINTVILVKLIERIKNSESAVTGSWQAILEAIEILFAVLAISVVFIFMYNEAIVSAGMIMFWGIVSITITNLLFTRPLLLAVNKD